MNLTTPPAQGAPRRSRPLRTRPLLAGWLLGTALLAGTLAGCAAAPELDRNAAGQLQSQVLAVTEAAAANDPAASLKHLDELVLALDEAAARGEVSFKRHQSIRKSVDTVRADLIARQAEADPGLPPNRKRQRRPPAAAAQAEADAAAAAAAAAPPPAVAPAPPADTAKGKKGKGKDD